MVKFRVSYYILNTKLFPPKDTHVYLSEKLKTYSYFENSSKIIDEFTFIFLWLVLFIFIRLVISCYSYIEDKQLTIQTLLKGGMIYE